MSANRTSKNTVFDNDYVNELFYDWFVRYNPLYFVSAMCFILGVFLVSEGMRSIDWIDGQILLTGVIEFYQLSLLAGSFILYRILSQRRPAVILAIMNIFFLFDCTYQTENLSSAGLLGSVSTVLWVLLFALKIKILTVIFRLKIPAVAFIVPVFAAVGVAGAPYLFLYTNIDKSLIHLIMTWYGVILAALILWFRPAVVCGDTLDERKKIVLQSISNSAWLIWGGLYLFHIISWIRFHDVVISPANIAPIFIVLAFVSKKEAFTWAACIFTFMLSISNPPFFWLSALSVGMVFFIMGWKNHQSRLYIGAILCLHFSLATGNWQTGPFPDPAPWVPVLTIIALLAISWIFRMIEAFLSAVLVALVFWNPRGPRDIMDWGALFIAIGFATLVAGVIVNWKFRFMPVKLKNRRSALPPEHRGNSNFENRWLRDQEHNALQRKMLKDLADPCPHCKFNLKSGKDKCDVCGKAF